MSIEEDFLPLETSKFLYKTGNLYKSVNIAARRADQVTVKIKEELAKKLADFAPAHDNLEEITENREQIEISKHYEAKPKAVQIALEEFRKGGTYWRNPADPEDSNLPEEEKTT